MKKSPYCTIVVSDPVPKGRPRFTRRGRAYTPERTRLFEEKVAWRANIAMRCRRILTGPVHLEVTVEYRNNADIDNFVKAAMDGINGIVFKDDRQVVSLKARKYRLETIPPRMRIRVWELPADAG